MVCLQSWHWLRRPLTSTSASRSSRPLTAPVCQHFEQGDLVECQDFDGSFKLGLVAAVVKNSGTKSYHLETVFGNGQTRRIKPTFVRFQYPLFACGAFEYVLGQPQSTSHLLANLEKSSKRVLQETFHSLEKAVDQQLSKRSAGVLDCASLVYEADIARAVFGENVMADQLYAVHLYLHSYTEKFGCDSAYRLSEPANGDHTSRTTGAGPYFVRSSSDQQLLQEAKTMLHGRETIVQKFQQTLQAILASDSCIEQLECLHKELQFRPLLAVLQRAATVSWQDQSLNPFYSAAQELLQGIVPFSPADLLVLLRKITPRKQLEALDIAKEQSGVDFRLATSSDEQLKGFRGSVRVAGDDADLYGRTQFEGLAIAIDSPSTVQVDDAVSVQKVGNDVWLHVHVADPARLIPLNSHDDLYARSIASNIYLPQSSYLMLPVAQGLAASLDPARPLNATMTFSARLAADGDIAEYQVSLGVVRRLKRISYEDAEAALSKKSDSEETLILRAAMNLAEKHQQHRRTQGMIEINLPKGKVFLEQKDGRSAVRFHLEGAFESASRLLVSECMVIAGRIAAMFASDSSLAVPFRYHADPAASLHGADFVKIWEKTQGAGVQASLFEQLQMISYITPSAVDVHPRRHWSMGLSRYCKSSSPLRRYFDLLLHHQLHAVLLKKQPPMSVEQVSSILPTVYRHEQHLKRLEHASSRYWTLCYIEQLLRDGEESNGTWRPLRVTVVPLQCDRFSKTHLVYIQDFALRIFCTFPGGSSLHHGVSRTLEIVAVDPIRRSVQLRIP